MSDTIIDKARGLLAAAIRQSIDSDDQIMMDHIRAAYKLLGAIGPHRHVAGTTVGLHIDTCALCERDIREDVHRDAHG